MNVRAAARSATAALLLAFASQPAAASGSNDYDAAVEARLDGRPAEAMVLLNRWLTDHPNDADALLQLALTDLALGRLDAAEDGFSAVLRAAPDYADAATGLKTVRELQRAASVRARPSVALDGSWSALSRGEPDWREVALDIEVPMGLVTAGSRLSRYRRFGASDVEVEARTAFHPTGDTWFRVHAGVTPNADFRPEVSFGGGVDVRLARARNTIVTLDGTYQRFPAQDVVTLNPAITHYFGKGHSWVTLRGIATAAGPIEVGALARIDHEPYTQWRVFAGAANGPDTDIGTITRTSAVFAGVTAPLGNRASLTGALSREWRGDSGDRTEFRLVIRTSL